MAERKSDQLFATLYNRLSELGRHAQARDLVELRRSMTEEHAADLERLAAAAGVPCDAASVLSALEPPPTASAQQPALQAGAPAGEQAVVAQAGAAGLPAESEQPNQPIP